MRILIDGETISAPTGFGGQTRELALGLAKRGHEVHVSTCPGSINNGITEVRQWYRSKDNVDQLEEIVGKVCPDFFIEYSFLFGTPSFMRSKSIARNCPSLLWLAWEGMSTPADQPKILGGYPGSQIVHLTEFSKNLWAKDYPDGKVIPHGIDLKIFKVLPHRESLKEKWAKELGIVLSNDCIVIINTDRNSRRKNWDLCFDYIRKLRLKNIPVHLIAHSIVNEHNTVSLTDLAKVYGVAGVCSFTNKQLSPTQLCELYNISDFHVSFSGGEGFGLPTLEAMACGCVNIVPNNTAFTHLAPLDSLVDCCGLKFEGNTCWAVPNVDATVERTLDLRVFHDRYTLTRKEGLLKAKSMSSVKLVDRWEKLILSDSSIHNAASQWVQWRYGLASSTAAINKRVAATDLLKNLLLPQEPVTIVMSGSGDTLDTVRMSGILASGVDTDGEMLLQGTPQANSFTTILPSMLDWKLDNSTVLWLEGHELLEPNEIDHIIQECRKANTLVFGFLGDPYWNHRRRNNLSYNNFVERIVLAGFTIDHKAATDYKKTRKNPLDIDGLLIFKIGAESLKFNTTFKVEGTDASSK